MSDYLKFRHAVGQYDRARLLTQLGRVTAHYEAARVRGAEAEGWSPWALTAVAKESVLGPNRSRLVPVRETLDTLAQMYWDIDDLQQDASLESTLTPIVHEQFPYRESVYEEFARALALFTVPVNLEPVRWEEVFGISLERALMALFIINVGVLQDAGRFNGALMDEPQFRRALSPEARRDVQAMVRVLQATPGQHQQAHNRAQASYPIARRLSYNPLLERPLVDLAARGTLAPSAPLVFQALSTRSLFYRGVQRWGDQFAADLGRRVEALTGELLKQVAGAEVFPEAVWHPDGARRTADWFLVTPSVVVVIECKSARPSLGVLAGEQADTVSPHLVKARKQIDTTADLIAQRHPAVAHIPADRPIVGLVVTAEPFYLANSRLPGYGSQGRTPSMVASLRALEFLTRLPAARIGTTLDAMLRDARALGMLELSLGDLSKYRRNPVLTKAWDQVTDIRNIASSTEMSRLLNRNLA